MKPRYAARKIANPNRITLDLDYDTHDRLMAEAEARKLERHRCAYELLQEALGLRPAPVAPAAEPPSDLTFDWRRICAPPAERGG